MPVGNVGFHCSHDWYGDARPKHSIPTGCRFQASGMGPTLSSHWRSYSPDVFPGWSIASSCSNVSSLVLAFLLHLSVRIVFF